jgi:hypothetical protein
MIMPKATHIRVFARGKLALNEDALVKRNNCPIAIRIPPNIIQFRLPKNRSDTNPPSIGVR